MKVKASKKEIIQKYFPIIGLAAVVIFFEITTQGGLLAPRNLSSLLYEVFTLMIGTIGMTFLLSQGCLDFSVSSIVAFAAALAAMAANVNPLLALPVAILAGLLVGLINGFVHAVLKVTSFIATLAVSYVFTGIVTVMLGSGSISVPYSMLEWDSVWLRLVVMIGFIVVGYIVFEKTRIGKECKMVGANPEFARQCGVRVKWVKIRGFLIMGGVCGVVAFFALIRSATAATSTGSGFTVNALNALLIGGMPLSGGATAKMRSAIIGSLIMAVLTVGMNMWGLGVLAQQVVTGIVFLFAIAMTFDRKNAAVIK